MLVFKQRTVKNMFFLLIEAKHNKKLSSYLSKAFFSKNRTWTSFAYCGFAFFAYHGHVFLSKSMKFILTACFTLRNCSNTSVLTIFLFLGHFFIFEHFNAIFEPHRPIQNCSRVTQISISIGTLCFCKKKVKNIAFNTIFLGKMAIFCTKTRFFFFWLKLGQNEHQNLVLQPF